MTVSNIVFNILDLHYTSTSNSFFGNPMALREIKPFHFAYFKKKPLKSEEMAELYKGEDLIKDIQVKKTLSKYSGHLYISKRLEGFIHLYTKDKCIKFEEKGTFCRTLETLFRKFTTCEHLDLVILNVDRIFYSFSRVDSWKYSVNSFVSLDGTYTDYPVEEVFDSPDKLLGDYKVIKKEDPTNFTLDDLEVVEKGGVGHLEASLVAIDISREKKDRTIKYYETNSSFLDFWRKSKGNTHTITFGRREGDSMTCTEKKIPPVEFNKQRATVQFITSLVEKMKKTSTDFVEVDCDALIYILKNNKGLFLFTNIEIQNTCSKFLRDFHEVFALVVEKYKKVSQ